MSEQCSERLQQQTFHSTAGMDRPPAVPPKDVLYITNPDREPSAPPSGSKRKRESHDDTIYEKRDGRLEVADTEAHTPKRSRSSIRQSDSEMSDDTTPAGQRSLRRKRKVGNLSNLSLRHAAEQQARAAQAAQSIRGSKFVEGSLTDKPSAMPPSVFTRVVRTESGNLQQVEDLMADYHEDAATPRGSVDAVVDRERKMIPQRVGEITAGTTEQGTGSGFFRFGRSVAANFRPMTLWNRMWTETKDDMARRTQEETEKARQKAEAESKYAQMKSAGQLGLKPVSHVIPEVRLSVDSSNAQDSAVVMEGASDFLPHSRSTSAATQLHHPPREDVSDLSASDAVGGTVKQNKTLRSRFHFRKPSLSNLKSDLKRVRSEFNLAAAAGNRESSSSLSPNKTDFDLLPSTLKRSASKYDLKKQHKLSKRVSDLESKLQQARRELDDALVEASPMPRLNGKYERFTPQSTLKRPKFIPGRLPSLPSERILMAEQMGFGDDEESPAKITEPMTFHPSEADDKDTTVRQSRGYQYPARASSLFNLDDVASTGLPSTASGEPKQTNNNKVEHDITTSSASTNNETTNMDPRLIMTPVSEAISTPDGVNDPANYSALDAKLKALDAQVKKTRKPAITKKRKSGANDDTKLFKPSQESEDDAEWNEASGTTHKKHKSGNAKADKSPRGKRTSAVAKKTSPGNKTSPGKKTSATKKTALVEQVNGPVNEGEKQDATSEANASHAPISEVQEHAKMIDVDAGAENDAPARTSMDSQAEPLEPLYEEEENSFAVLVEDAALPELTTGIATPARELRVAPSRSSSPHKRNGSTQPSADELLMARAAEAARKHPGRAGRSVSPMPPGGEVIEVVEETVTVVPAKTDVPKGVNGSAESYGSVVVRDEAAVRTETLAKEVMGKEVTVQETQLATKGFEWPEDVF